MSEQTNGIVDELVGGFSESVTSDTPEPEIKEESVSSNEPEPEKVEEESKPESTKPPEKKSPFQKRIDTLTAQRNIEREEKEHWKQIALKASVQSPEPETKLSAPPEDLEPKAEDYQEYADFVKALGGWSARQEHKKWDKQVEERIKPVADDVASVKQTRQTESEVEQTRIFNEKIDAGRTRYGDNYDENIGVALAEDGPLSPTTLGIVFDSDRTADLLNYLGENPEEAERISAMSPLSAAMAIGKITAGFENLAKQPNHQDNKQITKANPPIKPVPAGSNKAGINLETASLEEYMKATGIT